MVEEVNPFPSGPLFCPPRVEMGLGEKGLVTPLRGAGSSGENMLRVDDPGESVSSTRTGDVEGSWRRISKATS